MTKLMPVLALGLLMVACQKREETTASETRPVTMRDQGLNLEADNAGRFGRGAPSAPPASPGPAASPFVADFEPPGWTKLPGTSFRLLNYAFGEGGEVSVGLSRGGVLDNVNRWLGQFGESPIDEAGLGELTEIEIAGYKGVLFGAEGSYAPGMGRPSKEDQALSGIVAEKDGQILTVKMVGPRKAVSSEGDHLTAFAAGLRAAE